VVRGLAAAFGFKFIPPFKSAMVFAGLATGAAFAAPPPSSVGWRQHRG
jgi:hypothetical protein